MKIQKFLFNTLIIVYSKILASFADQIKNKIRDIRNVFFYIKKKSSLMIKKCTVQSQKVKNRPTSGYLEKLRSDTLSCI